jgi:O-antigen/teichoic acid export membrane protein
VTLWDSSDHSNSSSAVSSVFEGAGLFFIGKLINRLFGFITNILLTRFLGADLYGLYSFISVVFNFIMVFTRLGGDKSVLKFLPEFNNNPTRQNVAFNLAFGTSLLSSVVFSVGVYIFAPGISELTLDQTKFVSMLRIAAFALPFLTLTELVSFAQKGLDQMEFHVLISSILKPAFRLVFVGGAVLVGLSLSGAVAGYVSAALFSFIFAVYVLVQFSPLGEISVPDKKEMREYYGYAFPLIFTRLGSFLYSKIDILMVGFLLSSSQVGIYNIAVMVSNILSMPLVAFNQMFPSTASQLYHNDETEELESIFKKVTRWVFTLAVFPSIATIVFSAEILSVFGGDFVVGEHVLRLFVIAQLVNCVVGPSGFLLMMTDHQYVTLYNQVTAGIANVILNFVLIKEFGLIGAALATASILVIINATRIGEVWYFLRISPYNWEFVKPLGAALVSSLVMYGVSATLDGLLSILAGFLIGLVSFIFVLYILGINEADIRMFRKFIEKI